MWRSQWEICEKNTQLITCPEPISQLIMCPDYKERLILNDGIRLPGEVSDRKEGSLRILEQEMALEAV